MTKVCIIGASGKLGRYMVQHALDRGYEVVGVCRERSVGKLDAFQGRITIIPGATNDRAVIERAVAGCDGVLTVLVPWGHQHYATGTAQAVLDYAPAGRAPDLLLRLAHHPGRPGCVPALHEARRSARPLARAADPPHRYRRPGGGVPADFCQRYAVDGRARERPRRGREPGPARVEPARGRSHPREQHDPPRGLRPVHGRGSGERRLDPRSPGHRRLPHTLGARPYDA